MTSTPPVLLPRELDLRAIHEAFLAAGFTHDTRLGTDTENWVYLKPGDEFGFIALPNPYNGFNGDGAFFTPEHQRQVAVQALDTLIEHTGNPHLHCGPRNEREQALIDALNAASTSTSTPDTVAATAVPTTTFPTTTFPTTTA